MSETNEEKEIVETLPEIDMNLEIIMHDVDAIIPYENNPRDNDNSVDAVIESIKNFGFLVPIVIDKDNVLVAGHTRIKALKKMGIKQVPCILADKLTEEQIKAYRLADNMTMMIGFIESLPTLALDFKTIKKRKVYIIFIESMTWSVISLKLVSLSIISLKRTSNLLKI